MTCKRIKKSTVREAVLPAREPAPSTHNIILELIQYNEREYYKHADLPTAEMLTHFKTGYVNWINVDGLFDPRMIQQLSDHFCLHSLLVEDITTDHQPKAEEFDDYLFFTLKMLYRIEETSIDYEQISFVLGKDYLLSFQEKQGDLFNHLRQRIELDQGRIRKRQADYLLYRLVDTIVDNYYHVLDAIGHQIESIEDEIYNQPSGDEFRKIQGLKKELIFLRKALYPLRDALSKLVKDESGFIQPATVRYFADVYDHVVHLIDSLDTYKDLTSSLMDIHINTLNTRLNEVMKTLTIISVIFMPLTFIVGVYGMNFEHMPEIPLRYGYFAVWGVMLAIALGMIAYFRYRKWF